MRLLRDTTNKSRKTFEVNDPSFIISALTIAASAGAAWGSVKVSLNGTKRRIQETHAALHKHMEDEMHDFRRHNDRVTAFERTQGDRLARLETKIDLLLSGQLHSFPGGRRSYDPDGGNHGSA